MPSSCIETCGDFHIFPVFREAGVLAAFSTRSFDFRIREGSRAGFDAGWRAFSACFGLNAQNPVCLHQVHGRDVVLIDDPKSGRIGDCLDGIPKDADALLSQKPGVPLAIFTADCAPVFLMDPVRRVVGLAHIGWKGARLGLAGSMVDEMKVRFGSKPFDITVGVGPLIRSCCYEVGEEFKEMFGSHVEKRSGKHYFSLDGLIRDALIRAGISAGHLLDSGLCTACRNDLFFSYRREKEAVGRLGSFIMLKA